MCELRLNYLTKKSYFEQNNIIDSSITLYHALEVCKNAILFSNEFLYKIDLYSNKTLIEIENDINNSFTDD